MSGKPTKRLKKIFGYSYSYYGRVSGGTLYTWLEGIDWTTSAVITSSQVVKVYTKDGMTVYETKNSRYVTSDPVRAVIQMR